MIKALFDGSCEPVNPGGMGAYGVIIEMNGEIIHTASNKIGKYPTMTNNVAEYAGLCYVLEWLLQNNYQNEEINIYGDSQLVIKQMNLEMGIRKGAYVEKANYALKLMTNFPDITFNWIPREENQRCDDLSKMVVSC